MRSHSASTQPTSRPLTARERQERAMHGIALCLERKGKIAEAIEILKAIDELPPEEGAEPR